MAQSRQLAAIMFTDIVGYTTIMGQDSDQALKLLQISKELQKPLVEKHQGEWLKEMGDGVLVKFYTATDAVNCAIEIQREARADFEAKLRIGIHLGDITVEAEDIFGDGVNVASRIEAQADPGGIYISESIEKAIRGQLKLELHDLGELNLKNVDYGVRTFAVQGVGLPVPGGFESDKSSLGDNTGVFKWTAVIALSLLVASWISYLIFLNNGIANPVEPEAVHLQIALPEDVYLAANTDYPVLTMSPDGSSIVFVGVKNGRRDLYIKNLIDPQIQIIKGTQDALHPFYSNDGNWIAFVRDTHVMKVSAQGGVPVAVHEITPMSVNRGLTWYQQDSVVHTPSPDGGLAIGSISGNTIRPVTDWKELIASEPYYWPSTIPEIGSILFTDFRSSKVEDQNISLYSRVTGEVKHLIDGGTYSRYSRGHVFFTRNGSLYKTGFDLQETATGSSEQVIESLYTNSNGSALYAVGGSNLVYVAEKKETGEDQLVWVDRDGNTELIFDNGKELEYPRISSSGDKIAITIFDGPNSDLWLLEMQRDILTRLTSHPGEDFGPVWHPNEKLLAFSSEIAQSNGENGPGLAVLKIHEDQPPERYLPSPGFGYWEFPLSWSPDGRYLMFAATTGNVKSHLEVMEFASRKRSLWYKTGQREGGAAFSPDGEWVVYTSRSSGRDEIYLRPFQNEGPTLQVSSDGGTEPIWSPDGNEIFYRNYDKFMSVKVNNYLPLELDRPVMLFEKSFKRVDYGGWQANYDINPDGSRFIMIKNTSQSRPRMIHVILNWDRL